jgi:imidazolonepropionase-like amidohydrolase
MSPLRAASLGLTLALAVGTTANHATAAPDCKVLTGARVMLPDGPSDDSVIVLVGEQIAAAGRAINGLELNLSTPRSARFKGQSCVLEDHTDRVITAGLIEVDSNLGLVEVGLEQATRDHTWEEGPANRAALVVADAYNPHSSLIPVARLGGITSALIVPRGGLISGQGALVDLSGGSQHASVVTRSVALYANLTAGSSRAANLLLLRQALQDARFFQRNASAHQQGRSRELSAGPLALVALDRVVRNQVPLVVRADRAADIEAVLRLAEEENIRVVVRGGAEAWLLSDELARARVAVILDPMVYGPGSFDQIQGRADNAALLSAAGVPVIISTGSSHFARNLRHKAGNAVRGGLDHETALAAITSTPAEVFGLVGRGHIESGSAANLVIWSGDPLELSTAPIHVLIRGKDTPLRSRQTALRERYRSLPGSPIEPPPLP